VRNEIERFLERYQAMAIAVRPDGAHEARAVRVHVPYMMGTVTWIDRPEALARQRPRHQARLRRVHQARQRAPPELQAFFRPWCYGPEGRERLVAIGKSGPEAIRQLLQAALDEGLVPVPAGQASLDGAALRAWLQQYGIGVDCGGFVQHALTHLLRAGYAAIGETASPATTDVGWLRAASVYRKLVESAPDRRFDRVATPAEAHPGEILVSAGHVRIIVACERAEDGACTVTLAESTSRTDLVGGTRFTRDVGPRLYQVRYPEPALPIRDQVPLHKRTAEAAYEFEPSEWEQQYLIARNKRLVAFRQTYWIG
jgi:hypothetical protein